MDSLGATSVIERWIVSPGQRADSELATSALVMLKFPFFSSARVWYPIIRFSLPPPRSPPEARKEDAVPSSTCLAKLLILIPFASIPLKSSIRLANPLTARIPLESGDELTMSGSSTVLLNPLLNLLVRA
jgi:hypothetical protein